ncbi:MAG TPA: amidase [Casimicrobiaceae bacterium]|jgi:Asp-tRNA(Asn)/Glu-tRNA(Gln) amidotransferase A subunit family amidase|nr:amidase [Casimicrobiaceae bacterium]
MTPEPYTLTLAGAVGALSAGALSCTALTQSLLDRIDATDANVQAWAWLDRERALDAARALDVRRTPGGASRLYGVPIGVKDIVATAGMPTQMGSPIYAGAIAAHDADCIARLNRAGGMVLGKTVTTEFAFMQPGKTRNPWNAACTPGGSSSGSAAAVALGQVPASIGTQTNGSVIRPAAYCGIVGFKPGKDLLPFGGVHRFSPTLDTLGVFARTVADCALFAEALASEDDIAVHDSLQAPPALACLEFPWVAISSEQCEALDNAADALRNAGARVTRRELPPACRDAPTELRRIMLHEAARELGALQDRERGRMSAKLNAALDEGRAIGESAYADAMARRSEIIAALTDTLAGLDAVVTAPAPGPAPQDLTQTGDPACCSLWSLAGFPALSLPIALAPNGLPLGMQLAAPVLHDHRLLSVGQWCEQRLPFRGLV